MHIDYQTILNELKKGLENSDHQPSPTDIVRYGIARRLSRYEVMSTNRHAICHGLTLNLLKFKENMGAGHVTYGFSPQVTEDDFNTLPLEDLVARFGFRSNAPLEGLKKAIDAFIKGVKDHRGIIYTYEIIKQEDGFTYFVIDEVDEVDVVTVQRADPLLEVLNFMAASLSEPESEKEN